MTEWRKGDLAVCVKRGYWIDSPSGIGPRCGQMLTVAGADCGPDGECYLRFTEFPPRGRHVDYWWHKHFIKVTPSPELISEERKAGVLV